MPKLQRVKDMYKISKGKQTPLLSSYEGNFWQDYVTNYDKYDRVFRDRFTSFYFFLQDCEDTPEEIQEDFSESVYSFLFANNKRYAELYKIHVLDNDIEKGKSVTEEYSGSSSSDFSNTIGSRKDTNKVEDSTYTDTTTDTSDEHSDTTTLDKNTYTDTTTQNNGERIDTTTLDKNAHTDTTTQNNAEHVDTTTLNKESYTDTDKHVTKPREDKDIKNSPKMISSTTTTEEARTNSIKHDHAQYSDVEETIEAPYSTTSDESVYPFDVSKPKPSTSSTTSLEDNKTTTVDTRHGGHIDTDTENKGKGVTTVSDTKEAYDETTTHSYAAEDKTDTLTKGAQKETTTVNKGAENQTITDEKGAQKETTIVNKGAENQTTTDIKGAQKETTKVDTGATKNTQEFVKGAETHTTTLDKGIQEDSGEKHGEDSYTKTITHTIDSKTVLESATLHRDFWNAYNFYISIFDDICKEFLLV